MHQSPLNTQYRTQYTDTFKAHCPNIDVVNAYHSVINILNKENTTLNAKIDQLNALYKESVAHCKTPENLSHILSVINILTDYITENVHPSADTTGEKELLNQITLQLSGLIQSVETTINNDYLRALDEPLKNVSKAIIQDHILPPFLKRVAEVQSTNLSLHDNLSLQAKFLEWIKSFLIESEHVTLTPDSPHFFHKGQQSGLTIPKGQE